jgi:menaquinone-dependent protoporphyrinogen oxidase
MRPILVLYATREGQTRWIAEHIAAKLREKGFWRDLIDVRRIPAEFSLSTYSAAILAASVHVGKHESEMVRFVRRHRADLQQMPTAFLSVSLSQAGAQDATAPAGRRDQAAADVKRMITIFLTETHWHPTRVIAVAGALMYSKYNFFLRFNIKRIARQAGTGTDSSRDHEFTDWATLDRGVVDFIRDEVCSESARIPA